MNSKLFAAGSIVALALCGAGAAVADSGHKGAVHKPKLSVKAHVVKVAQDSRVGPGAVFDAAVGYLQIDKQTLFEDLRNGQSLAQIAVAQGKTSDGLIDVVVAAAQAQLDVAVAAGKLDAAKEQTLLAKMRTALADARDEERRRRLPHARTSRSGPGPSRCSSSRCPGSRCSTSRRS